MAKTKFDPDNLALSKKDILEFCDKVIKKWQKNPSKNGKQIFAMNAVKTSIIWTDEESLKAIWNEIIKWIYELLYENEIARGTNNNAKWSKTMKKLKTKKS